MKKSYDLSPLSWSLTGWHPQFWESRVTMELGLTLGADVNAVPAAVPGSVQMALHNAGLLPDWNEKLNSRQCEWVENRHWVFETKLPAEWTAGAGRALLKCDGLDYQGVVLVNGKEAGAFKGTYTPYSFDVTPLLKDGENRLDIVFTDNPGYLGQVGHTSRMTEWKARFYYIWDWTPRIVQVGVWDDIRLEISHGDAIDACAAYTEYDAAAGVGSLTLKADFTLTTAETIEVVLTGQEGELLRQSFPATAKFHQHIAGIAAQAWHPNGNGAQPLYSLSLHLLAADGELIDETMRMLGFREVTWKQCRNAPAEAEPWICCVNGIDTFLQGVDWVPIRPNFADVTEEDYRLRLVNYRDMGLNILRIWGGAVLEKECFYRLCDELGILVWQEFSLSSSGIENWPPEDPTAISEMREIVASYIARRQHHPSLLLWCGGNELQGALDGRKMGCGKPVDNTHPMMAMMRDAVATLDPTRRFLPSSSSGPRFTAEQENFGKGIHHDVHGPWNMNGSWEEWTSYWDHDDALFRSETGMPGSGPAELIRQYGQEMALPASRQNPFWMHTGGWWIQWDTYLAEGGNAEDLDAFVAWSQARQAKALVYAVQACKRRFPGIGGIILWMGHDCYPCPANTSIVDFNGKLKPAATALAEVFNTPVVQS